VNDISIFKYKNHFKKYKLIHLSSDLMLLFHFSFFFFLLLLALLDAEMHRLKETKILSLSRAQCLKWKIIDEHFILIEPCQDQARSVLWDHKGLY
jgi:hypothetical protein